MLEPEPEPNQEPGEDEAVSDRGGSGDQLQTADQADAECVSVCVQLVH
jgi:hypothetical protein